MHDFLAYSCVLCTLKKMSRCDGIDMPVIADCHGKAEAVLPDGGVWVSEQLLNFPRRSLAPRANKKFKFERRERTEERGETAVGG